MLSESKSKSSGSIAGSSSSSHQRAAAKPSRAPRARRPAVLAKQASDPDKEKEQDKAPAYESVSADWLLGLLFQYKDSLSRCRDFHYTDQINGLVQERHNSSVLAMELRLSCTNPTRWL